MGYLRVLTYCKLFLPNTFVVLSRSEIKRQRELIVFFAMDAVSEMQRLCAA